MPELETALQECLEALRGRRNLPETLKRYPADRDELIDLLRVSNELGQMQVPGPDPAFKLRVRSGLLAAAAERRERRRRGPARVRHGLLASRPYRLAAAFALTGALLLAGLSAAAGGSLPGEPLYTLKLGWERAQLEATRDSAANTRLRLQLAERRLDEAERLSSMGRATQAVAVVTQFDAAVSELNVRVNSAPPKPAQAEQLARDLERGQQQADQRLQNLAGTLAAGGNTQAAALVTQAQTQANQTLKGTREALKAHGQEQERGPEGGHDSGSKKPKGTPSPAAP